MIIEVIHHKRHAPAPHLTLAGFPGAMSITIIARCHAIQNIRIIPQALQGQGWGAKTVWAFEAGLGSGVWELTC